MTGTNHTPAVSFDEVPGEITTGTVSKETDYDQIAELSVRWMSDLSKDHLAPNAIWRDFLSFTDTFRTFYSPEHVFNTFHKLSDARKRTTFETSGKPTRPAESGEASWLNVPLTFTIRDQDLIGHCGAIVSVTQDADGRWKIWMIRTWLENYEGFGHPDHLAPTNGHTNGQNGVNRDHVYDVIIVGGGHAGLGAAGRFQALGVDYILFDEKPEIGDSWASRYDSLKWHTTKEYGNLPFGRTFDPEDPTLLPIKRIASGYKAWAERFGLNTRSGVHIEHADWDEAAETWTVYAGVFAEQGEYRARNLVLCMGPGHKNPMRPAWASKDQVDASGFKGTVKHSLEYQNCNGFAGKRGIVVGTANTAHDIASDMVAAGMETVMLQRSPTWIIPGAFLVAANSKNYHLDKPTEEADREELTNPQKISRELVNRNVWKGVDANPKLWDDLEKAGFRTIRHGDLFSHLYNRFGGHYVDIGNCQRIIDGQVKVVGTPVKGLTEEGIEFEDGSHVPADLVVCCTGYNHDFRKDAADVVGDEIAEQMDDFFGVDKEGELRGYCRLAGRKYLLAVVDVDRCADYFTDPHLFYHGGEVRLARFYSRFLALQLQKLKLGKALSPYREGK